MGLERAAKQQGSQLVAALLKGAAAEEPRRGPKSSSSSYKGVTKHRRTGRWEAHIWGRTVLGGPGKQIYLGGFVTPEEAAEAHDIAAVQLQGANAKTNFHLSKYAGFLESRTEKGDLPAVLQLRRKASTAKRSSSTTPPARAALGVMPPPKAARRGLRLDTLGSPDSDSTQTGNEQGPSTPAGRQFGYGGLEREDSITSRNGPQRPMPVRPGVLDQAATLPSPEGFGHSLTSSSLTDGPSAFHSPLPGLLPFHSPRLDQQGAAQRAEEATVASGFPITDPSESRASTSILLAQALLRSFGSSTLPAQVLESLPDAAKALLKSLQQQAADLPCPAGLPLRGFPIAHGELATSAGLHPLNELPSRPLSQSLWSQQSLSGGKRDRDACQPKHDRGAQGDMHAEEEAFSMPPSQPLRGEPLDMNTLQTILAGTAASRSAAQPPWHAPPAAADAAPEQGFAPQDKFVFPTQPRSRPANRTTVRQVAGGRKASHGDDLDTAEALLSLKRSL